MRDTIYSFLEALLGRLKKRPYRLDRRIPLVSFAGLFSRRAIWLLRGILKTTILQFRPKAIFIASGVELRNAAHCRFGRGVTLERGVIIDGLSEHHVVLGDDVAIGPFSLIRCSTAMNVGAGLSIGANSSCDAYSFFGAGGFVSIGSNVIMGQHVSFHAEAHNFERLDVPIRAQGVTMKPITIEDDCWIGANATFLGGAYVSRGSIVGAGAVVNKQYPPFSIIAGVPAKVIKTRQDSSTQVQGEKESYEEGAVSKSNVSFSSDTEYNLQNSALPLRRAGLCLLFAALLVVSGAGAQVNVITKHNDNARTGQNLSETLLTPANVNSTQFGKLFSQTVNGGVFAQPLYVSGVAIPGAGTHNVVYVATNADRVYAFDADSNGGIDASPLWTAVLIPSTAQSAPTYATPVIDLSSNTIYVISNQVQNSTNLYQLHALDITTGAEKFGGPVPIQASVPGTGSGSSGGVLTFNAAIHADRPALMELNGIVYLAFGSVSDNGPWHGWIFSYNAATLKQINVLCTSPNGSGAGIWMGDAGPLGEVNNPAKPYGRMFVTTGNGSYAAGTPYTGTMSYGMSILDLDLTGGVMTVQDEFTPYNEAALNAQDGDFGSGGPVYIPPQTTASGGTLYPLVQVGKSGTLYVLNRNNLGGFNAAGDQVVQKVQTPQSGTQNWGAGVWGSPAYWNQNLYFGGTNPGSGNSLTAYSFINGVLSSAPTSQSAAQFYYPGPTPSISANGTTNGIVWAIQTTQLDTTNEVLFAFDATNLANLLYSSNTNLGRDNPGPGDHYAVPTIANGKVYVGASGQLVVYGLLNSTPTVAAPVISPPGATFTGSQIVTITDATSTAKIYYTTNGTTPTVKSTLYTGPFAISANTTVAAIASATGYLQGAPVSASFSSTANTANPVFSLASGTYSGTQTLNITDASAGAKIYYTVDGSTPTAASTLYTGKIYVAVEETVQAIAISPGLLPSSVISANYDVDPAYTINLSQGFAEAQALGQIKFNGSTDLDDFRLQLTNGGVNEAGSAFYTTPVPVWAFTTDFTFQLSNPVGDGITFTIQGNGPTALGANARNLGYGGMPNSVAIAFNIYNNSTVLTYNGANPALYTISMAGTGINLTSGDYMNVHITYDSHILNMTITDAVTLASWSQAFSISIPYHVGGSSAYVGFTGGTGGATASQKLTSWTYIAGLPVVPNYPTGFDTTLLALNGGTALSGTNLQLTNSGKNQATSAYYLAQVSIASFTSDFDLQVTKTTSATLADGFTFVIQDASSTALGSGGGGLGYVGIPNSLAIKFELFNGSGSGTDTTGVYENGASTPVSSFNLSPAGVNLANGSVVHVHVTYDGTTLAWSVARVQGVEFPLTANNQMTVNIPHIIGSNTAWVGFTAGTADSTATQTILDWTFTNP